MSDLILTKHSGLLAIDTEARTLYMDSQSVYSACYRATVGEFTLPSGLIDAHNMGVYLTAMTNKLYPVDKCKGKKGAPATAHKAALDAYLKHYGKAKQAAKIQDGQQYSLIAKSTPPKKGETERTITVTYTPVSVIKAKEKAQEAAEKAAKEAADKIEQELAELAEKDRLAMLPLDIAEAAMDFIISQWPDCNLPEVIAEMRDLATAPVTAQENARTGTDG